jgi:hypothetical protein
MPVTVKKVDAKTKSGDDIELFQVASDSGFAVGRFDTKAAADRFAKCLEEAGGGTDIATIHAALRAHGIKSKTSG